MITVSLCLETVFPQLPVDQRIAKIAEAGFQCVEFWHPEGTWDGATVRTDWAQGPGRPAPRMRALRGVTINDFALHAWDGSIGGSPVKQEDRARYVTQIRKMIAFAREIGCRKGITLSGTVDPALSRTAMRKNLEDALAEALAIAEQSDFTLLLEPLNTLVDHPGYYLASSAEAFEIVRAANNPHLKVLVRHLPHASHGRECPGHDREELALDRPFPCGGRAGSRRTLRLRARLSAHLFHPRRARLHGQFRIRAFSEACRPWRIAAPNPKAFAGPWLKWFGDLLRSRPLPQATRNRPVFGSATLPVFRDFR